MSDEIFKTCIRMENSWSVTDYGGHVRIQGTLIDDYQVATLIQVLRSVIDQKLLASPDHSS